jgi:hypothetical protein
MMIMKCGINFVNFSDLGMQHSSKICFVKFYDAASIGVAQHLTNTVFVDRALIVIPYMGGIIKMRMYYWGFAGL